MPPGGSYAPGSLATEGFVHCSGDDETLLRVANAFYRRLEDRLKLLPGVEHAAIATSLPVNGYNGERQILLEGQVDEASDGVGVEQGVEHAHSIACPAWLRNRPRWSC